MVIDKFLLLISLAFGVGLFILGSILNTLPKREKKQRVIDVPIYSQKGVITRLNASDKLQLLGSRLPSNNKALTVLFRMAKNPWGLTISTYNLIRYGGLVICLIIAIPLYLFDVLFSVLFAGLGACFFIIPIFYYKKCAARRESQWNQLYQFIWVIKHNLSFYDPKKVFLETENYISDHAENLPELVSGFHDFADHWNGSSIDDYLRENYCDFSIPKELLEIVLNSQKTGEYPENELNSLRRIILEKMNFHVQKVLSLVGTTATCYSAPFLLLSVSLVILVPVIISIIKSFS